jgi:hypothetical protein
MSLVEEDHKIEQIAPAATNPALRDTVLSSASKNGPLRIDTQNQKKPQQAQHRKLVTQERLPFVYLIQ